MNATELAEAMKEYEKPFAADRQARPLTAAQRAMHRRAAKSNSGREVKGRLHIRRPSK
jgi:hypothetical protein